MTAIVTTQREISLGGWRFPILAEPRRVEISRYPSKFILGDITESNEQNQSAYIMKDFTGGLGIKDITKEEHSTRFWNGPAETMRSKMVGLPPYAHFRSSTAPTMLLQYAEEVYACMGTSVRKWDTNLASGEGDWSAVTLHTLQGTATGWIDWNGKLYIACGNDGYTTFDGTTWTDVAGATQKAQCFGFFDQKLWKIDPDGALKSTTDGTTWTLLLTMTYPAGSYRGLFEYLNLTGDPALHIVHKKGIDYVDVANATAYRSGLQLPLHPHGGKGALVWRGDMVVYFAGLTGYSYIPGAVVVMGLDREDGIPASMRGNVVDMEGGHSMLFAALDNTSAAAPPDTGFTTRFKANAPKVGSPSVGLSTILAYNGIGWHHWWSSDSQNDPPISNMLLSDAYGAYRLWFAAGHWGNHATYFINLPMGVYNPQDSESSEYASLGRLVTPWMDGKIATEPKTALSLSIRSEGLFWVDDWDFMKLTIAYGLDGSESWTYMGGFTEDNPPTIKFGDGAGLKFHKIRFRFNLLRENLSSPITMGAWFKAKFRYRRSLPKLWGWEVAIDCRSEYKGRTAKELTEKLISLAEPTDKLLVPYAYKFRTPQEHYVDVSIMAEEKTGMDEGAIFAVQLATQG